MPSHTSKSLFDLNMASADRLLKLYDVVCDSGRRRDVSWLLRAPIVFSISALDAYFHDKIKYRAGRYALSELPRALGKFEIPMRDLERWNNSKRKGNVIRNWVTNYYSVRPLQRPDEIANALKLVGIENLWNTIEPNNEHRNRLLNELAAFTRRRNQIAHEGDREGARNSGKTLRPITRKFAQACVDFVRDLIGRVEAAFPN